MHFQIHFSGSMRQLNGKWLNWILLVISLLGFAKVSFVRYINFVYQYQANERVWRKKWPIGEKKSEWRYFVWIEFLLGLVLESETNVIETTQICIWSICRQSAVSEKKSCDMFCMCIGWPKCSTFQCWWSLVIKRELVIVLVWWQFSWSQTTIYRD